MLHVELSRCQNPCGSAKPSCPIQVGLLFCSLITLLGVPNRVRICCSGAEPLPAGSLLLGNKYSDSRLTQDAISTSSSCAISNSLNEGPVSPEEFSESVFQTEDEGDSTMWSNVEDKLDCSESDDETEIWPGV